MVVDGGPMLIRSWMNQVDDIAKERNIDIIWVTSGAIASARKISGIRKKKSSRRPLSRRFSTHIM